MNKRLIENIKVKVRRFPFLYTISKVLYKPVSIFDAFIFKMKLKRKVSLTAKFLKELKPSNKKVFYFGVPIHENLGDTAQMYCIRKWININYSDCELVEIETWVSYNKKIRSLIKELLVPNDIIIIESGATFSNIHDDHEMHRYILSEYTDNKVLFMPNTVNIFDEKEIKKTAALFNNHYKAVFLARDPESLRMVTPYFNNKRIYLFPDIVTSLIGNIHFNEQRNGILVCKRIDGEKKYTDSETKILMKKLCNLSNTDLTDTDFESTPEYTYNHVEEEIIKKIKMFASYDVVLTDRYHGMIFSLIANTPVVVLATKGHKVREGALWFKKDYPNSIWFCESPESAYSQVELLVNQKIRCENKSFYKEQYFDKLKELFEQTV